jgi:8-oxo-dGTP pyrophosphatase MutT (NUDIX family)
MAYRFEPELRVQLAANLAAHDVQRLQVADARHAAVGVVLLPNAAGEACFVLTRRLATLRRHSGQWALPGGRLEPEETPVAAALREIHEEIGLDLPAASLVGALDDFWSRSGHLISPFVFWADAASPVLPNPDEVHAAYLVPLEDLDAPDAVTFSPLLHFNLLGTTVFAPTAALLYQFREVALHARLVRVHDTEQPFFAWR